MPMHDIVKQLQLLLQQLQTNTTATTCTVIYYS